MESVGIVRALWRRRVLVGAGVALGLVVVVLGMYRVSPGSATLQSRTVTSGYAQERVLVDTRSPLLADARAKGADSVVYRAVLLGALLGSDRARAEIAGHLGLKGSEIEVVRSNDALPQVPTPLAEKAIAVAHASAPYVITVASDASLPILSISATAPDARRAAALARQAIATLRPIADRALPAGDAAGVERVGKAEIGVRVVGPRKLKAFATAIAVFAMWCLAIVFFDHLLRRRGESSGWPEGWRVEA